VSSATGGSAGGGAPAVLTASDRGVTADSIKLAFGIVNIAGLDQAGVAVKLRTDIPEVVDALVDEANKQGGVLGRKIIAVKLKADITSPNDQRAKCLEGTQNQKVFAMMDFASMIVPASRACVALENKTPLITYLPGSSAEVQAAAPFVMSTGKDDNRRVKDLAYGARDAGFFDPAKGYKKLGLLIDNCEPSVFNATNGLKAYLREVGITSWSEFTTDCDAAAQQRSGPQAVLQFQTDGVTNVLLAAATTAVGSFLTAAKAQGFHPKYFVSDFWALSTDTASSSFDPDQFDQAQGLSSYHKGDPLKYPAARTCSKIFTDHGLPPATNFAKDAEALTLCDHLQLFLQAAKRVGADLTRTKLSAAVQVIGDFNGAVVELARFNRAGKYTGGDALAPVQWRRDCTCWVQVGDYRAPYG
jgi:ABC-type branched-subunit amino acid transport system substrate-binding protein